MQYYAHSVEGEPPEAWQLLEEHLKNVGELSADFAASFGGEHWAKICGEHHDLGKGSQPWQAYLRRVNGVVDEFSVHFKGHPVHAVTGAQMLEELWKEGGKLLAYCVAGHHGGLPNWYGSENSALKSRLKQPALPVEHLHFSPDFPTNIPISIEAGRVGFQVQFFVRMLFSCLVDADYLDTELFLDKKRAGFRTKDLISLATLHSRFWQHFNILRKQADQTKRVNVQRENVLKDCIRGAQFEPGLFSLTVPTGGGKTLASMAFALNHAKKYNKRRINLCDSFYQYYRAECKGVQGSAG